MDIVGLVEVIIWEKWMSKGVFLEIFYCDNRLMFIYFVMVIFMICSFLVIVLNLIDLLGFLILLLWIFEIKGDF